MGWKSQQFLLGAFITVGFFCVPKAQLTTQPSQAAQTVAPALAICQDTWSLHFAWSSYTAVYSSLVHLYIDKPEGGLRAPLL